MVIVACNTAPLQRAMTHFESNVWHITATNTNYQRNTIKSSDTFMSNAVDDWLLIKVITIMAIMNSNDQWSAGALHATAWMMLLMNNYIRMVYDSCQIQHCIS